MMQEPPQGLEALKAAFRGATSLAETVEGAHPFPVKWKVRSDPKSAPTGRIAFAVLGGDKDTGEVWVLAILEGAAAPKHRHNPGGPYGERIITLAGALVDTADDGTPVLLEADQELIHAGDTIHEPRANFWVGLYHQPCGSEPVE